jgi:hypothetical protein
VRLPHVISGSGARYSDGKTTFWNKGRSVLVEVDDKIIVQDCMLEGEPQGWRLRGSKACPEHAEGFKVPSSM